MSITVVGSLAYDAVEAPAGKRERMLGGAATHFALAASFFDTVHVVGPVGGDFDEGSWEVLRTRGTNTDDVEVIEDGKTFFWAGRYHDDLNTRDTLDTQLNVFEHFEPKLSDASRDCDVLFLANIQPSLQLEVRRQCERARFVAMDSMNLWIDIARDELVETIKSVHCLILNDEELGQLTGAPTTAAAADELLGWGLQAVVAKLGKYGASVYTHEGMFSLPAFPLRGVTDPTGAGDTFAGGFVGAVAAAHEHELDRDLLAQAMAYGTALASFNVEAFGTERMPQLMTAEIEERVDALHAMTAFEPGGVTLRQPS